MSCDVFCNIFVCGKGEAGDEPFSGHVPVDGVCFSVYGPAESETFDGCSEVVLGDVGGEGEDAFVGVCSCSQVFQERF